MSGHGDVVNFASFTRAESEDVSAIVDRAVSMFRRFRVEVTPLEMRMDIAAVHYHTPLKLGQLLAADDFNFSHDIGGIRRHIDRTTGQLTEHFMPRYAQRRSNLRRERRSA